MGLSNGGIIGVDNDPDGGVASGVWNIYDVYTYVTDGNWV
tara:strand:- start:610 stop:729 length:120 start_codon:yes stop_codon:yes gene_type:complete